MTNDSNRTDHTLAPDAKRAIVERILDAWLDAHRAVGGVEATTRNRPLFRV